MNRMQCIPELNCATKRRTNRCKDHQAKRRCLGASAQRAEEHDKDSDQGENVLEIRYKRLRRFRLFDAAKNYNLELDYESHRALSIGKMDKKCIHCSALKYDRESHGLCCTGGKVKCELFPPPPSDIYELFTKGDIITSKFMSKIRQYNSCFQMTSFGTSGSICRMNGWNPSFKINGQVYHKIGSLLPLPGQQPKYLQVYFIGDKKSEIEHRCKSKPDLIPEIVTKFQRLFDENNLLIRSFLNTQYHLKPYDVNEIVIRPDLAPSGSHSGCFNRPTADEVAAIIVNGDQHHRDIIVPEPGIGLKRIMETHPLYDAMQYPLILWRGDETYHLMRQEQPFNGKTGKLSCKDYYAYQLMIREGTVNFLLHCGQLLNQFIVDMYAKVEAERLRYIRDHQADLRAAEYSHLRDALGCDIDPAHIGKRCILPATFTGSPRHMHEYAQDAMAYVRLYGCPDLFITFTCNNKWKEINEMLPPYQASYERNDIVARVFNLKLKKLMECLTKHKLFGETRCYIYTVEWQKRGLPHAHILLWLRNKIQPAQIDSIICAELPDPIRDPDLAEIVQNSLVHGPCGLLNPKSPCMDGNRCTKKFPRPFSDETMSDNDGYPLYRRRKPENGGQVFQNRRGIRVDNQWVVPYNPVLTRMFNAHINVEYCNSVKSIKYICKYINKGSDMAMMQICPEDKYDEIKQYLIGRYISSNEAFWRIFNFSIHMRSPSVVHLQVHLENGQRILFNPNKCIPLATNPPRTTLTAFFSLCADSNDELARTLLYSEVPTYYTWNEAEKVFLRRKYGRNSDKSKAIGRIYTVHPSQGECFFLRILLTKVRGPISFENIRSYNGIVYDSYREACQARGLLEHDKHWENTLDESIVSDAPRKIRELFAIIITSGFPSNPDALWQRFKGQMSEDILNKYKLDNPSLTIDYDESIYNETLIAIEDICMQMVDKSASQLGLPTPLRSNSVILNSETRRESNYDRHSLELFVEDSMPKLNSDQKLVYNTIIDAINADTGGLYFIDAPGGTGKTFLINLTLAKVRSEGGIALAVASSGIAATLLTGGRTAHSAFKIPIDVDKHDAPVCNINKNSAKANLLCSVKVIIWDECTMAHKKSLQALDRTLKDIRGNNLLMGGVVTILAGDFRQTLPVVKKSTAADQIDACLKQSYLWRYVKKLPLRINMRAQLNGDEATKEFSNELLRIGDGIYLRGDTDPQIRLSDKLCRLVATRDELINKVFPNLEENIFDLDWLSQRAILAPKNDMVDDINLTIQSRLTKAQPRTYYSYDSIDPDQAIHYPTEFLNSLAPASLPPHELILRIGTPVMLLRNLNPPKLCNGTRLVVKFLEDNLITATIMTGACKGEDVLIPRIPLCPSDSLISFKRMQFPIRLAFSFTVNKSQGQSLNAAGIELSEACFSHGQLYVACSRVGKASNLYILAPGGYAKNVVYQQALK